MFGYSVELLAGVAWQAKRKLVLEASIVPEWSTFNLSYNAILGILSTLSTYLGVFLDRLE